MINIIHRPIHHQTFTHLMRTQASSPAQLKAKEAVISNIRFTVEDAVGATSSKDIEFIVLPIYDPGYIDDGQTSLKI